MKKLILPAIIILFICSGLTYYFRSSEIKYVQFTTESDFIDSYYRGWMYNIGEALERHPAVLPVLKDDVLVLDNDFVINYEPKFGSKISWSNINSDIIIFNNKYLYIELTDDPETWSFLSNTKEADLANIKTFALESDFDSNSLPFLKKLFEVNNNYQFYFTANGSFELESFRFLLSNSSPRHIFFDKIEVIEDITNNLLILSNWTELRSYTVSSAFLKDLNYFIDYPNINNLIVICVEEPSNASLFSLTNENIETLTLVPYPGVLYSFNSLPNLKSLSILNPDGDDDFYIDLDLRSLKKLKYLNLPGVSLSNMQTLKDLPKLKWFSTPINMTSSELTDFLSSQQELEVLELLVPYHYSNLNILADHNFLKYLALDIKSSNYTDLYSLDHIKYISLEADFDDLTNTNSAFYALQQALPDTQFVPRGTFCLGPGWLLFIFPFLALACILRRRS